MKKLLVFIIMLIGCSSCIAPNYVVEPTISQKEENLKKIGEVLLGDNEFMINGEDVSIKELVPDVTTSFTDKPKVSSANLKNGKNKTYELRELKPVRFGKIDIDLDGVLEILVEDKTSDEILFHYEDGKVYGYIIPFRAMKRIKYDVTFESSDGAGLIEYGRLRFIKGECVYTSICKYYLMTKEFRINGQKVEQKIAEQYVKKQDEKEPYVIEWYDYTDDNIKTVLM